MGTENNQPAASPVLSIEQFCQSHSISRAFFNKLRQSNQAPDLILVGRRVLISTEAAAAWRARFTVRAKP
ncbi:MAG: hypothetical protein U1A72_19940 [Sulfuritalea sp.]|nr:hypothetical protein [Sulfuritalea sp.]